MVLFDQAHHNFMRSNRTARHLLDLLRNDGYRIRSRYDPLDTNALSNVDVLIIANPYAHSADDWYHRGYEWWKWSAESAAPAIGDDEITAIVRFVRDGGSLLLAVGGAPWAGAASELATALGIQFRNADTRAPGQVPETEFESRGVHFMRSDLREQMRQANPDSAARSGVMPTSHPIVRGDGTDSERLWQVQSYLGQSIVGPAGSVSLLDLPDDAVDWFKESPGAEWQTLPAAGRSQAVAFELGKGRIVVVADAAVFFARVWRARSIAAPMAMAWPEDLAASVDPDYGATPMNRQFALNVMHWLSGAQR